MTAYSYSSNVNRLQGLQSYTEASRSRLVVNRPPSPSTNTAQLEHFNSLVYYESRYTEDSAQMAEAYQMLQKSIDGLTAVADQIAILRNTAFEAADPLLPASDPNQSDRTELVSATRNRLARIDETVAQTAHNGLNLLDGSFAGRSFEIADLHLGAMQDINAFPVDLPVITASSLGLTDINLKDTGEAERSLSVIDSAAHQITTALNALTQARNHIQTKLQGAYSSDLWQQQTRVLSFDVGQKNLSGAPTLNYLNGGPSLKKATLSFFT